MKGHASIFTHLNKNITAERVAVHAYMLKSRIFGNWGYKEIASTYEKRAVEEMRHMSALLERVLFLEGEPEMTEAIPEACNFTWDVESMLKHDLSLELGAVAGYNQAIKTAESVGDNGSRQLFQRLVADEESHTDWLESQLQILGDIGKDKYLQEQV